METYTLIHINHTDSAILVHHPDEDPDSCFWLPNSQIEYDESEVDCAMAGEEIEVRVPGWLAEKNGLK